MPLRPVPTEREVREKWCPACEGQTLDHIFREYIAEHHAHTHWIEMFEANCQGYSWSDCKCLQLERL